MFEFEFELLFMNKVTKWQYTTGDNEHSRINLNAVKKKKRKRIARLLFNDLILEQGLAVSSEELTRFTCPRRWSRHFVVPLSEVYLLLS